MGAVENSVGLRHIATPSFYCPCCGQRLQPTALTLDRETRTAFRNGRVVRLKQREFDVLAALMSAYPRWVDVATLTAVAPSLRPAIAELRSKLDVLGLEVRNVHGRGYVLASVAS